MALSATEEAQVRQLLEEQAAILSLAENEAVITSKLGANKVNLSDLAPATALAAPDIFFMRQGVIDKSATVALILAYILDEITDIFVNTTGDTMTGALTATAFTGDGSALTNLNGSNIASGIVANARTTATNANTANTIVSRDASGNFSAGTITATFSGNGAALTSLNAVNLASGTVPAARLTGTYAISISGNAATVTNGVITTGLYANPAWITALDAGKLTSGTVPAARLSGSYAINISGNAATATNANNSNTTSQRAFTGDISTTGQGRFTGWYAGNAAQGPALEVGYSGGNGAILAYDRSLSAYRDLVINALNINISAMGGSISLSGVSTLNGSAPVINNSGTYGINITGNANTATALQTARLIQGVSFNGTANINVVTAGTGITVAGTAVSHADTSAQASVNNSGNTFIQDITLDQFGHITAITSGTVPTPEVSNYVVSGAFAPVFATGSVTFAHGFGTQPKIVGGFWQAIVANNGYAVGDRIPVSTMDGDGARVTALWSDATNIACAFGSLHFVISKAGTAGFQVTTANWRFYLYAVN